MDLRVDLLKPVAHISVVAAAAAATADGVNVLGTCQGGSVVYLTEGYGGSAVMRSGNGMPSGVQVTHFCTQIVAPVCNILNTDSGGGVYAVE